MFQTLLLVSAIPLVLSLTEQEEYNFVTSLLDPSNPATSRINSTNLCNFYPTIMCSNGTFGGPIVGLDFSNAISPNNGNIDLSPLQNLTVFDCSNCSLSDITLPPSIRVLVVPFNNLVGLDVFNEQHPNLELINVRHNPTLSMNLPPGIGFLKKLRYFYADHCALSGNLPTELANITTLQRFEVQYNHLNGTIPPFSYNSSLSQLLLHNNSLRGELPRPLPRLLQLLTADGNKLSGLIPPLPRHLQGLYLNDNFFSGPVPDAPEDLVFCDLSETFLDEGTLPNGHACQARDLKPECELGAPCECEFGSGTLVCTYVENVLIIEGTVLNGTNAALGDVNINGITTGDSGTLSANGAITLGGTLNINVDDPSSSGTYIILESMTGISGQFDEVLVNGQCKTGAVQYDGSTVSVSLAALGPCLSPAALGGIIGGSVFIALAVVLLISCYVRRKRSRYQKEAKLAAKAHNIADLTAQREKIKAEIKEMEDEVEMDIV